MGREALDAAAGIVATRAALAAATIAVIVILPAILAALLDHLGRAQRVASLLRRMSPPIVQRVAAIAMSVCIAAAFSGRVGASGADGGPASVSEWLRNGTRPAPTTTASPTGSLPAGTWYADPGDPSGAGGSEDGGAGGEFLPTTTVGVAPIAASTTAPMPTTTTSRAPSPVVASPAITNASGTATPTLQPTVGVDYIVVPGDCLWTIAAHRLPATATAADVDREWRRIYGANRTLIGENPGLILPGQRLTLPPIATT